MADDEPRVEQPSTPSEDAWLEERLTAIDEKVKSASSTRMPDVPDWKFTPKPRKEPGADGDGVKSLGVGMTAAYALVGGMIFGFGIGWLLDRHFGTSPVYAGAGGLIGLVASLIYVFILLARANR